MQQGPTAARSGSPTGTKRQVLLFGVIGGASAIAYLGLYLALRHPIGAQLANIIALVSTQLANTAVNRRLTFGIRGRRGFLRHQAGGLAAFGFGLALSSGSLWVLHHARPQSGRVAEVVVLIAAQAVATAVRFLTLRAMMHRPRS